MPLVLREFDYNDSLLAITYRGISLPRLVVKNIEDANTDWQTFKYENLPEGEHVFNRYHEGRFIHDRRAVFTKVYSGYLQEGLAKVIRAELVEESKKFTHTIAYVGDDLLSGIEFAKEVGLDRCTIVYCGCSLKYLNNPEARRHSRERIRDMMKTEYGKMLSYIVGGCSGWCSMGEFFSDFLLRGRVAEHQCGVQDTKIFFDSLFSAAHKD